MAGGVDLLDHQDALRALVDDLLALAAPPEYAIAA
jgi:hypothetical protein